MIDSNAIAEAVNQQISTIVNEQVLEALADPEWLQGVENKLLMWCQNRLYGKFENIESSDELKATVQQAITDMFNSGEIPGIAHFVNEETINTAVASAVKEQVAGAIEELSVDSDWLADVQSRASTEMTQRVVRTLRNIDIPGMIKETVDGHVPAITETINRGIRTTATETELTVMDGYVVAENSFAATDIEAVNSLKVKNLAVTGSINTDNESWDELKADIATRATKRFHRDYTDTLVNSVKESIKAEGIDVDLIKRGADVLLDGETLSRGVRHSQLNSVGVLDSLRVSGDVNLREDTLHISREGRIGVNTQRPETALSVWDDDIAINIGKKNKGVAFVGTSKNQELNIGVNNGHEIRVMTNGDVRIENLRVGRNKLGHSGDTPGTEGLKGDLLINSNYKPGDPWGWLCLGSYRYEPLWVGSKPERE